MFLVQQAVHIQHAVGADINLAVRDHRNLELDRSTGSVTAVLRAAFSPNSERTWRTLRIFGSGRSAVAHGPAGWKLCRYDAPQSLIRPPDRKQELTARGLRTSDSCRAVLVRLVRLIWRNTGYSAEGHSCWMDAGTVSKVATLAAGVTVGRIRTKNAARIRCLTGFLSDSSAGASKKPPGRGQSGPAEPPVGGGNI